MMHKTLNFQLNRKIRHGIPLTTASIFKLLTFTSRASFRINQNTNLIVIYESPSLSFSYSPSTLKACESFR